MAKKLIHSYNSHNRKSNTQIHFTCFEFCPIDIGSPLNYYEYPFGYLLAIRDY